MSALSILFFFSSGHSFQQTKIHNIFDKVMPAASIQAIPGNLNKKNAYPCLIQNNTLTCSH